MSLPRPRRVLSAVCLLLSVVALSACGSDEKETQSAPASATPASEPSAEESPVAEPTVPDEACPVTFVDGRHGDAVATTPEEFTSDTPTWACRYELDSENTSDNWTQWVLVSTPVLLTGEDAGLVEKLVTSLEPKDPGAACPTDLGTRILVSHEIRDAEQAHAVIDEFGCNDVILTSNLMVDTLPWTSDWFTPDLDVVKAITAIVDEAA